MRISLGTRIFVMTAALVVTAVASAVLVTNALGARIAQQTVRQALTRASAVQSALQQQRLDQLGLIAQILAGNPLLVGYVGAALDQESVDVAQRSVLDQLEERQGDLGFDFGMVLDGDGFLVARTDDPEATGDDLAGRPLVAVALDDFQSSGVWAQDGALYYAVAAPITENRLLIGFFVAGFAINDFTALEIGRTSGTDVVFVGEDAAGARIMASTLQDPSLGEELLSALAGSGAWGTVMERGESVEQLELSLDGRRWIGLIRPLTDADGQAVGAVVSIASLEDQLLPFQRIATTLLVVGLVAVALALVLSFLLSRRAMGPVRSLLAAAKAAKEGDYQQRIGSKSGDEIGQLAASFDVLLSELREKQDMESYIGSLSRSLGSGDGDEEPDPPASDELAFVVVDLRGYTGSKITYDPEETMNSLSREVRRVRTAVESHKGRVESTFGARVLASFSGPDRGRRALGAAAEILGSVGKRTSAFDTTQPPAVALTGGEAVSGSVFLTDGSQRMLVGRPFLQLDGLLREATPGELVLTPDLFSEVEPGFSAAGIEAEPRRGLLSNLSLYLVTGEQAAAATGVQTLKSALETTETVIQGQEAATLSEISAGSLLGERFEILGVLGAGGMGVVYKVRDRELDDLVALKMLKQTVWGDRDQLERLKSELKLARKITHPNVLRTFDFGDIGGMPFISMEYVRGITLRTLLQETGALPYSAGLRLARQLCKGLAAAHAVGVIHRDIKPENLIVEPNGNAKLMDFGIARPISRPEAGQTAPGTVIGTPQYMAPEQLQGEEVDERADLYAVGVVLYEVFTARLPFEGGTVVELMMATLKEEPTPPSQHWSQMPPALERMILKCLDKKAKDRYRSASELLSDLDSLRA